MILFSPAKLNLFLRVVGKREDGYHELATLMQAVNLGDTLKLNISDKDYFTCSSDLLMDQGNLVIKALRLFRAHTGINQPIRIHLEKRIPIQAGMGGGSSNAATTLWGLNSLFGAKLPENILMQLGAQLGSDVPFFFTQGRTLCRGRGEILEPLEARNALYTIYLYPKGASTAQIFGRCSTHPILEEEIQDLVKGHQQSAPKFVNDLQPITEELLPDIIAWKKRLPHPVTMTGSGSAYFCEGLHKLSPSKCWNVHTIERRSGEWYNN